MLRLTLVLATILVVTLSGRDRGNQVTTEAPRGKGGRNREATTTDAPQGKGGRGNRRTTQLPLTTEEPLSTEPMVGTGSPLTTNLPRSGGRRRRGNRRTTQSPLTTRSPRGSGNGGNGGGRRNQGTTQSPDTTNNPRGGGNRGNGGNRGGRRNQGTTQSPNTTNNPRRGNRRDSSRGGGNRGGGNMNPECDNSFPQDDEYTLLLNALFGNDGELVETGAEALEAYELAQGPGDYNNNVRFVMDDLVDTLVDYNSPDGVRVVLILQDGTVVYDSSRGNSNTFANSRANNNADRINENHNSRVSVLVAQLSSCGVGYERKLSTTTGNFEYYVAFRVFDQYASFGTVRVSYIDN